MARTVQSLMAEFVALVDPVTKAGVDITASNVGVVDGGRFTKQQQLDIYNKARIALANGLRQIADTEEFQRLVGGIVAKNDALAWASQVASKPSDYIDFILMYKNSNNAPMLLKAIGWKQLALQARPHHVQTATYIYIFEEGDTFTAVNNTAVPDGNATLYYIKLATFVLADVTGGATQETINTRYHPVLIQLAVAIAMSQGALEVDSLARSLLGGGKE